MSAIKELRKEQNLTQQQAAELIGISIRSFKSYENDESKAGTLKYKYILDKLKELNRLDEDHGILSIALQLVRPVQQNKNWRYLMSIRCIIVFYSDPMPREMQVIPVM